MEKQEWVACYLRIISFAYSGIGRFTQFDRWIVECVAMKQPVAVRVSSWLKIFGLSPRDST